MLKALFILLACANAAQDKTIREANKNWLTVGEQTGQVLLGNLPTNYPKWKPATLNDVQSKHGRSPNLEMHGEYPQVLLSRPRLRSRKRRQPPENNL